MQTQNSFPGPKGYRGVQEMAAGLLYQVGLVHACFVSSFNLHWVFAKVMRSWLKKLGSPLA